MQLNSNVEHFGMMSQLYHELSYNFLMKRISTKTYNNILVSSDIIDIVRNIPSSSISERYSESKDTNVMSSCDVTVYDENKETIAYIAVDRDHSVSSIYRLELRGISSVVDTFYESITHIIVPRPPTIEWMTSASGGDFKSSTFILENPKPIIKEAYPCLDDYESIEKFMTDFINSDSNILFLYGSPGQGKTELIRNLMFQTGSDVLLTYSEAVIESDVLFSHFIESNNDLLVIEDADTMLAKREDGNSNMKKLLNITDGLTSNKCKKVIFTSNLLTLDDVDSALLREGRCFAVLHFKPFSHVRARTILDVMGTDVDLDLQKTWSLADLYAVKNGEYFKKKRVAPSKFGFA